MMSPLISVAMGVLYQRADLSFLKNAITSILSQSVDDFEFLICYNEDSSESASVLLRQYAEKDSRIKLIFDNHRKALSEKLNACLARAQGKFVARMDDDDFSYPNRFEKQIMFLNTHTDISFTGCNVALVRNGISIGKRSFPVYPTVRDFYMTQPYIHPALIFRREALEAVGGYTEGKSCVLCEDYDLLLRLYKKGFYGANLQEILLNYTLPATAKGSRNIVHRWSESVVRWKRFYELGVLPGAIPYVIKPIAVGLLPECILAEIKKRRGDFIL